MNLGGKSLPIWLAEQDVSEFPSGHNYISGYPTLVTHLDANIHNIVGAANVSVDGGFLTDHGPDHVKKLIWRLTDLLSAGTGTLSAYEVYLLLVAAQFHDVGNIFGRSQHEQRASEVMNDMGTILGIDSVEKRHIYQIAQAHGGEDKDKISAIPKSEHIKNKDVRLQLLAALLKFADELAEDSSRAARYLLGKGILPPEAELYHAYAQSLNSIMIDAVGREVKMRYELPRRTALKLFLKQGRNGDPDAQVYLIDEILSRTMKTHLERIYCSRFFRSVVDLESVAVTIAVTSDTGYEVVKAISYRLQDTGYPEMASQTIYKLCPELEDYQGIGKLDGISLATTLEATA